MEWLYHKNGARSFYQTDILPDQNAIIQLRFKKEGLEQTKLHLETVKSLSLTRLNGVITSVNQICLSSPVKGPCYNFSGKKSVS